MKRGYDAGGPPPKGGGDAYGGFPLGRANRALAGTLVVLVLRLIYPH